MTPGATWIADAVGAIARAATATDVLTLLVQRAASLDGMISASIVPAGSGGSASLASLGGSASSGGRAGVAGATGSSGAERIPIEPEIAVSASLAMVGSPEAFTSESRAILGILARIAASRLDVVALAPGSVPVPPASREVALDDLRTSVLALTRDLPGVVFRRQNDRAWPIEFISDACVVLFGHPASDFVQRRVDLGALIHVDDRELVWTTVQDALARREPYEVEFRFVSASGELRWASERGRGLFDERGEVIAIVGMMIDDTARRRAEEGFLRVERDLHEAHARLELALDAADVGFWEFYPATGRAFHSRSWKRQLGLEGSFVASDASAFEDRLHPGDRERVTKQQVALMEGAIERMDVECRVLHQDGAYRTVLARASVFRDASGVVQCIRGVHIDVSSRRAAEDATRRLSELAEQNRAVQTASRLKSEFLANMSHELRTPLNTIIGFAEVLLDNKVGTLGDAHREFVGDILSSGRHLLALINDVLDLSKVEAGKMEFYPETIALTELFSEVRSIVRELAARKRIRLTTEIEDGLTTVRLDRGRLKQVLYNYLSNAIKFTPSGGSVCLRAKREGEGDREVQFEVEDTGPGIPPDRLGLLFVEFQQLDASSTRQHGGTGLGLALTRRLVTAQGGRVGVRSAVGEGSAFFATLPREMMTEGELETIAPAAPMVSVHSGSPALLVVEDSVEDRAWLVRTLLTAGYAVQSTATVESAMLLARAFKFDAITVDLFLPDGDGFQLVQRIRHEGLQPGVPVVLISVASTGDSATGLLVHDALVKPLEPAELLASLHRLGVVAPGRPRVFVVEDEAQLLREASSVLQDAGYDVSAFASGDAAVIAALEAPPAAIVLDLMLDDTDGFSVLERLRESEACFRTPVVVWTGASLGSVDLEKLKSAHRVASVIDKSATRTTALVGVLDDLLRGSPQRPTEGLLA